MRRKPYPQYKASGVEWLGDVPQHWEVKRLKYFAGINTETLPETTAPDFEIKYVDISNVNVIDGITSMDEMVFEAAPSRARRRVRDGDTIVSTVRTYLRAIAPIKNPPKNLIVSTGFAVVRPQKVQPGFLSYALRESAFVESIVARSVGVSYPAINATEVGAIPLFLPAPDEQNCIADFLDRETAKLDILIKKKQALVEKLKEKRTALISRTVTRGLPPAAAKKAGLNPHPKLKPSGVEWLGDVPEHWKPSRLGFLACKIGSGKTPKGGSQSYQSEGVMIIRSQNVHDDGLRLDDVAFIDDNTDEEMSSTRVASGDVLLNITGASIGRCAVVPDRFSKANVNQHVCIIRPSPKNANASFLHLVMSSQLTKAQIFSDESGSSREGLNFQQVRHLFAAIPPLAEQRAIADFLNDEIAKLAQMIEKIEAAIKRLQEYRTALITAAVTGKIDVRKVLA